MLVNILQLVCPPSISKTVAVRILKLAHRPRITSTMIKLISKSILLSFLSILLKKIQRISAGPKANQSCGAETSPPFFVFCDSDLADSVRFHFINNLLLPSGRLICIILFSLLIRTVLTYSHDELNCDELHILITFIYITTRRVTSTHKSVLARDPSSY